MIVVMKGQWGKGVKDIVQLGLEVMGCEWQMGRERSEDRKDLTDKKEKPVRLMNP